MVLEVKEHDIQCGIFKWALLNEQLYPELKLLHASQNGLYSNSFSVKQAKRAGLKRGVPDIFLPIARCNYHGLFIELKSENGYLRSDQRQWLEDLKKQNYLTAVFRNSLSAICYIERYIKGEIISNKVQDDSTFLSKKELE